jgi:hypothetical protein
LDAASWICGLADKLKEKGAQLDEEGCVNARRILGGMYELKSSNPRGADCSPIANRGVDEPDGVVAV